jgi:hypothetical protein
MPNKKRAPLLAAPALTEEVIGVEPAHRLSERQDRPDAARLVRDRAAPCGNPKPIPKTCPRCWRSDRTSVSRYANLSSLGFVGVVGCDDCVSALRAAGFILDFVEDLP